MQQNAGRTVFGRARHLVWCGALAAAVMTPPQARAQGSDDTEFKAEYYLKLAILPLSFATGSVRATVPVQGRYSMDFDAAGPGFTMSGKASGLVQGNSVWPATSVITSKDSSESRKITLAMNRGRVRQEIVDPPLPERPDRVPLTDAHRRGVVDPLSAILMPFVSKGGPGEPGNCDRTLPVFEGTERFDIRLSYLRTEMVKTPRGYEGPAVVCRASYKAIAGHRNRASVQHMESNRTIEVTLAPIGATRLMAPWRVSMGTRVGMLVLEASEFTATGGPVDPLEQAAARKPLSETGTPR